MAVRRADAIAAAIGVALAIAGAAVLVPAWIAWTDARASWRGEQERLLASDPGYDAGASDAAWARADEALGRGRNGAALATVGIAIVLTALAALGRSRRRSTTSAAGEPSSARRALAATVVDGALLLGGFRAASLVSAVGAGDAGRALESWAPLAAAPLVLALVAGAPIAAGATAGAVLARARIVRRDGTAPEAWRALLAALLAPAGALVALVASPFLLARRTPSPIAALHFAASGCVLVLRGRSRGR